jgi:hypothetical protein
MKKTKLTLEKFTISELKNASTILGGNGGVTTGNGETIIVERPTVIERPTQG